MLFMLMLWGQLKHNTWSRLIYFYSLDRDACLNKSISHGKLLWYHVEQFSRVNLYRNLLVKIKRSKEIHQTAEEQGRIQTNIFLMAILTIVTEN